MGRRLRTFSIAEDRKPTQIVPYAGASGDHNPLHKGEIFTKEVAGYLSVLAYGMLTMGMTGRLLTDTVGDGRLTRYGVRFTAQVCPGDDLSASATVTAIDTVDGAPIAKFSLETKSQDGVVVLSGSAAARLHP